MSSDPTIPLVGVCPRGTLVHVPEEKSRKMSVAGQFTLSKDQKELKCPLWWRDTQIVAYLHQGTACSYEKERQQPCATTKSRRFKGLSEQRWAKPLADNQHGFSRRREEFRRRLQADSQGLWDERKRTWWQISNGNSQGSVLGLRLMQLVEWYHSLSSEHRRAWKKCTQWKCRVGGRKRRCPRDMRKDHAYHETSTKALRHAYIRCVQDHQGDWELPEDWKTGDEGGSLATVSIRGGLGSILLCLLEVPPDTRNPSVRSTDKLPFSKVKSYFCNMNNHFQIYFYITDLPLRQFKSLLVNHYSVSFTFFFSSLKFLIYQISSPN